MRMIWVPIPCLFTMVSVGGGCLIWTGGRARPLLGHLDTCFLWWSILYWRMGFGVFNTTGSDGYPNNLDISFTPISIIRGSINFQSWLMMTHVALIGCWPTKSGRFPGHTASSTAQPCLIDDLPICQNQSSKPSWSGWQYIYIYRSCKFTIYHQWLTIISNFQTWHLDCVEKLGSPAFADLGETAFGSSNTERNHLGKIRSILISST